MGQSLLLFLKFCIFLLFQAERFNLGQLETQVVLFGLGRSCSLPCLFQLFLCVFVCFVAEMVLEGGVFVLCYSIQHIHLEILLSQQKILMLGVNIHEAMGQGTQVCH